MSDLSCGDHERHYLLEAQLDVFEQNVARADIMADGLFIGDVSGNQSAAEQLSLAADNPEEYILLLKASVPMYTSERHKMLRNAKAGYALAQQACNNTICALPESIRAFDARIPPNGLPGLSTTRTER